ncbi:MAG: hypothetical protein KBA86_05135 [Bacteroidales bacterium]|nr:hypothetical protein [Bacteroidales bacterium]
MKTLLKTIVFIAILLLFSYCNPDFLKAIHYVDYKPDITVTYDPNNLEGISLDLYEDKVNDLIAYAYWPYHYGPTSGARIESINDSLFFYYGDRHSTTVDPILEGYLVEQNIRNDWTDDSWGQLELIDYQKYPEVFIALKWHKKDGIHYGWLRFRWDYNLKRLYINDYAIHNTAGASILTGQKEE